MDTKKLLAEVAREKSDSASMRALVQANTKALQDAGQQVSDMAGQIKTLSDQIAAMQAGGGGDVSALQQQLTEAKQQVKDLQDAATQAQNDIDQAASDLAVDSDASEAALAANIPQGEQAKSVGSGGAGSAGASSSSSSSGASDGGGVQKPSPLPGTGAQSAGADAQGASSGASSGSPASGAGDPNAPQSGVVSADATAPNAPPEDASAAGQVPLQADQQKLGSDPAASKAPLSGA